MIIFLPKRIRPTGGTSTFAKKFQQAMKAYGHKVTFTFTPQYDVLLASPRAPLRHLLHAKIHGRPIIHRLDGVYYPGTVAGFLWPLHNLPLWIIQTFFADFIVYQSLFCQHSCEMFLGKARVPSTTIYNGVDLQHFRPDGKANELKDNIEQHLFITVSRFRREDQLLPLLTGFQEYRRTYHKNSKLIVIGSIASRLRPLLAQIRPDKNIVLQGIVPNQNLPEYLRAADVFLFTHRNPPCPNNVIEAMSCGLPVCGIADGAMPELVTSGQNGQLAADEGSPYEPRRYDASVFAQTIHQAFLHRKRYATMCRQVVKHRFTLHDMANDYQHVLQTLDRI